MSVIPCRKNQELRRLIERYAETLKVEAHKLGGHGLSEEEFYDSGLFRGAVERLRGQFSATMRQKREFVLHVLNYMQDRDFIKNWESAGEANRHDYTVSLNSGRTAVIELKGCLDGNNTTIFERPDHAEEFIIWSLCTNAGADPRHNAWSGIHTRLSAEVIFRKQRVDGVVIWDKLCGTIGRPCPKIRERSYRWNEVAHYKLPPPCIYVMPGTVPSPRNNPQPRVQCLDKVEILRAFQECFQGRADEVNYVEFRAEYRGQDIVRTTTIHRSGAIQQISQPTAIRRA